MTRAAASRGLLFRENQSAVRLAFFTETKRYVVCRFRLEKVENAFAKGRSAKMLADELRREHVWDTFDVIARARMAFYLHSGFAQGLDPLPDGLALDADFFGDARAADDDGRIFGEQGEKGVDPAICRPGKIVFSLFRAAFGRG